MLRSLLQASIRTLLTNSHAKIAEHAQSFCRCVRPTSFLSRMRSRFLRNSDGFVSCDTTKRTSLRACHVLFDLLCNQSSLSVCQTDIPKFLKFFFDQWLIFRFLRLCIVNFIYKNNEFRFKNEFKRQAHKCKFSTSWIPC